MAQCPTLPSGTAFADPPTRGRRSAPGTVADTGPEGEDANHRRAGRYEPCARGIKVKQLLVDRKLHGRHHSALTAAANSRV